MHRSNFETKYLKSEIHWHKIRGVARIQGRIAIYKHNYWFNMKCKCVRNLLIVHRTNLTRLLLQLNYFISLLTDYVRQLLWTLICNDILIKLTEQWYICQWHKECWHWMYWTKCNISFISFTLASEREGKIYIYVISLSLP
jgi:hypothetical protein